MQHFLEVKALSVVERWLLKAARWLVAGYTEDLPENLLSLLLSSLLTLLHIIDHLLGLLLLLPLLLEAATEAALQLFEIAWRLGDHSNVCLIVDCLGVVVSNVLMMIIVSIVGPKEACGRERLIADHAIARLETWLRNVEISSSLLLLHLVLLSEDKARLLIEHVWRFRRLELRLGTAIDQAREVNLLGLLLLLRRGNVLNEALL